MIGKRNKSTQITKLNKSPSETITDSKGIANSFNTHFTNVGPKLAAQIPPISQRKTFEEYVNKTDCTFSFTKVLPTQVLKLLKTAKTGKPVGVDKIPNKILKLAAPYIYIYMNHFVAYLIYHLKLTRFPMTGKLLQLPQSYW